jgi:D-3-phosphoglycerate dehydrogenase
MTETNRPRILVTFDVGHLPETRRTLEEKADVTYRPNPSDSELLEMIGEFDGIVTNLQQRLTPAVIDRATRLRVIATPSTGTDHIDIRYAQSKGIEVQSLKTDYDLLKDIPSTAELAFALTLSCLRRLPFAFDSVKRGEWTRSEFRGRQAFDRVVGIIGYGRLGSIFSRFAHAFGMRVLACDPFKTIEDSWVRQLELDDLLRQSEIITLHVHLNDETRGMIGKREFGLMRDGIVIVNTSRGALIDEAVFLDALASGKVACAGIDVLANELDRNIANEPLVRYANEHQNLIITPHIGGCTYDAQELTSKYTAAKIVGSLCR